MSPDEFRRVEVAHQVATAVFLGAFVALCMMPFIEDGKWFFQIFGG